MKWASASILPSGGRPPRRLATARPCSSARRLQRIALDVLTSICAAAARQLMPPSIAATILSRKSCGSVHAIHAGLLSPGTKGVQSTARNAHATESPPSQTVRETLKIGLKRLSFVLGSIAWTLSGSSYLNYPGAVWHVLADAKILIVAQNASTRFGGEAIIPVHYFRILRKRGHNVRMLAHSRNRAELSEIFENSCDRIYYIDDTIFHRVLSKICEKLPLESLRQIAGVVLNFVNELFQRGYIRRLVREGLVDIIHQPIPVSPKMPSLIFGFGVPVIIGPMNGGMNYPQDWRQLESRAERYFVSTVRALATLSEKLIPGKSKANVLLVANERTRQALPVSHARIEILSENGVDRGIFFPNQPHMTRAGTSLRLVFMGRLVEWKAVDFSLRAISEARSRGLDVTLDVLGDGPDLGRLQLLTKELHLESEVRYLGFRSQQNCIEVLREADALILNSVYECGGAVILEAMSLGLPVIASEWGGPKDYVNSSTGLLVHPSPRETFAYRLADAIEKLVLNTGFRAALGRSGAERVAEHFDWERKIDKVVAIYTRELAKTTTNLNSFKY